jgi:hypothetical protein
MYKLSKTEAEFLQHQLKAHGGNSNVNCPFCRAYKKKIGDNWQKAKANL